MRQTPTAWCQPGDAAGRQLLVGALVLLGGIAVLAMVTALPALRNRDADLGDFSRVSGTVVQPDGTTRRLCLLYAETTAQHQRGLMGVTDPTLDGCDGMLFAFSRDTTMPFWMHNTPLPLSIAYFDSQGRLVSTTDMPPCGDHADCPSYPPAGRYRYAIEVPQGRLPQLGVTPGSRLSLESVRSVGATAVNNH